MTEYVNSASFATDFKNAGFRLLSCEVLNEETLYSTYNAPTQPNEDSLRIQVANYYSTTVTDRVLAFYDLPVSEDLQEWQRLFGKHCAIFPTTNCLVTVS